MLATRRGYRGNGSIACGGVWRCSRRPTAAAAWRASMSSNIIWRAPPNCADECQIGASRPGRCGAGSCACGSTGRIFTSGRKLSRRDGTTWSFSVPVDLGGIAPQDVAVQLYAEPRNGEPPFVGELASTPSNAGTYTGSAPASRPAEEYTVRIIPRCTGAAVPAELPLILWQN